ncbi:hypothetical protein, partial [Persicitalea sp.]|uniref:hypothetical protein n=1 Tax=Persicitalea sp. TaxID=3100273 RepID=UPI0035937AE9
MQRRFNLFGSKWYGCLILLFTLAFVSKSFGQCSAGADIVLPCVNGIVPSTAVLLATPVGGTWSNAAGNPTVATFTPNTAATLAGNLQAGTYEFIYTTSIPTSCSDIVQVTVPNCQSLCLPVEVSDTLVCAGSVIDLTSLVSGFDTLLSSAFTIGGVGGIAVGDPTAFVANSTTTITLLSSNLLGCTDTTTLTINVNLLDIAASDTLVCAGSVLDLTSLVSGFDTLLNVGFDLGGIAIANPTAFVADSTTVLTITASNLLGCADTTTLTINVGLLNLAASVSDTSVCAGSVLNLTGLVSGFDTLLNVGFVLDGVAVANATAFVADSTVTLMVTASTALGCSDTTTLTINVGPLDIVVSDTLVCAGSVLDLTSLVSGFDNLLNVAFDLGGIDIANASAFVADSTVTLTVTASNLLGCSDTTQLTVNVNPLPNAGSDTTLVCIGNSVPKSL